jgi:cytochrome c556
MKSLFAASLVLSVTFLGAFAEAAEDPFADTVEMRHGLMLLMATDLGRLGEMAKGKVPYDAGIATRAAANVAALASVVSLDMFPEGSEYGKAPDSYTKAEIWANTDDFLAKIAGLNDAAAAMKTAAGADLAALQGGMAALGGACSACHKAYRQPEE